jgi:glycosyltransferase involved in cell wall biosynthesis
VRGTGDGLTIMLKASRRKLSIVTPVYFNADSLPALFERLQWLEGELNLRNVDLELIFVDDGSGDTSLEELLKIKAARPATKVVSLSRNFGAVAASKTGFRYVTGDAFLILSADLQDPPEQVLTMADEWLAGEKFVVSVREARRDPAPTRLFAWVYYKVVDLMVVPGYPRGGFDLFLMDKVMLPYMAGSVKRTNPTVYAWWLGFRPKVLYYTRQERRYGKSRYTFRKKLRFLFDTFTGFSATPIRALSAFGVVVACLSFAYGLSVVLAALFGDIPVPGFPTLAALISFFSGMILIMLGTLGEYLWRIFDAVSDKPESVVDEEFL